jgi:DMSO/TMAO reductase YedYZ heme-binding membrane subunit
MSFSAALVAFILLAFLTVISHSKAIEYFGGVNWKLLMRFAYIAFISLTIHFFLKTYDVILQWVHSKSFIPPLAGTMFIFASLVVTIRLLVLLDSRLKKPNSKSQIPSKPETSST